MVWMTFGMALVANASEPYGPRRAAPRADLGALTGAWLEYAVVDGRRAILERCSHADPVGVEIQRSGSGFAVLARDGFDVVRYDVVGVEETGGRYELDLRLDGSPRSLGLSLDRAGRTGVLTWEGGTAMTVAGPSAGLPKVQERDCDQP